MITVKSIEPIGPVLLIKACAPAYVLAGGQPLGLLYIASTLRNAGYKDVSILDLRLYPVRKHFPMVLDILKSKKPGIVGISAMTYEAVQVAKLAALVKRTLPETILVAGGPFPSSSPEDSLSIAEIDYAVLGEGEFTMLELVKAISGRGTIKNIPGIAYRDESGLVIRNEPRPLVSDLDDLPMPAWELLDFEAYFRTERFNRWYKHKRYINIITSRGCPYRCEYCHKTLGQRFRTRAPGKVLDEILYLMTNYGIQEFVIVDDAFNLDINRAKKICDMIIERGLNIALTFPNGLRADRIDRELLMKLKQAGTYRVAYGIESTSSTSKISINKELKLGKTYKVIQWTNELGILSHGFFILGLPGETPKDIERTIEVAASTKLHTANFFFLDVYPGTAFWEIARKRFRDINSFNVPYGYYLAFSLVSELDSRTLGKLSRRAHIRFFLKPWRILRIFKLLPLKYFIQGIGVFLMRGFILWHRPVKFLKKKENSRFSFKPIRGKILHYRCMIKELIQNHH
jgi:anaerobic magnesium-protoporphyrin IX monomethyl ester cyclase